MSQPKTALSLIAGAAFILATSMVLIPSTSVAYGQGITTGTISGTTVDASGAAVPGAEITATSTTAGTKREATSGSDGSRYGRQTGGLP